MIENFDQWHFYCKIILFVAICLAFIAINSLILLRPAYNEWQGARRQSMGFNEQKQQQMLMNRNRQDLQEKILRLKYPYESRLAELRRCLTPAIIYTQIAFLAKAHRLKILVLKPQKNQNIFGLIQTSLDIDLGGSERDVVNFLRVLMHQSWLLELQQLDFSPATTGIHLHANIKLYYAEN